MKNFRKLTIGMIGAVLLSAGLYSCNSDDIITVDENISYNEKTTLSRSEIDTVQLSKEISLVLGNVVNQRPDIASKLSELVSDFDSFGEFISLASILQNVEKAPNYERQRIEEKDFNFGKYSLDEIKDLLVNEINKNNDQYKLLSSLNINKGNIEELSNYELGIAFPYLENHHWNDVNEFGVTFENWSDNDIQDAFLFRRDGTEGIPFKIEKEEQLERIPIIAVTPLEDFYNYGIPIGPIKWQGNTPIKVTLPPLQGNRTLLKQNYNPNRLSENSVLETNIPKVRVRGTDWKRKLSTSLRISVLRASTSLALDQDGTYKPVSDTYYYNIEFSRKNLKNHQWRDVYWQWDPNWNATEGSQQIVILNKRKNAGNTTVAVNTKVNVDSQGNATPETTMTFTHTSTEPKSINRGNREIDRKQALTTIINGAESHNETYNHNGVNYSVRKVDLFDYFFEYYYTNLD